MNRTDPAPTDPAAWRHPNRGLVAPDNFIPPAEEMRLIVPLGEWVIREACATAVGWPGDLRVAVNLSAAQFKNSGLVNVIASALANSVLPVGALRTGDYKDDFAAQ